MGELLWDKIMRIDRRLSDLETLEGAVAAHAASHEDGGADEIDVGGLSGELADPQPPKAHAASHETGGADEISLDGLLGAPQWLRLTACAVTISGGSITPTGSLVVVDTEGGAASDDLDTIVVTGVTGTVIVLRTSSSTRDVTLKDGSGNLELAGDMVLNNRLDSITLMEYAAGGWLEISRSDNA